MSITIHEGSILDSTADCIVNPANSFLRHGGGLAAIIEKAALGGIETRGKPYGGRSYTDATYAWHHEHSAAPLLAPGNAYWTSAGCMPFKGVVHAVGPIWNDGHFCEHDLLELAVESAILTALEHECQSIAFPAISCGIFGFPVEEAARIHVQVASHFEGTEGGFHIEFWPFGHEDAFRRQVGEDS